MKRAFFIHFSIVIGMALLLASVYALWWMTERVTQMENPLFRILAIAGEMVVGISLLFASLWVTTHLMVRLLAPASDARPAA